MHKKPKNWIPTPKTSEVIQRMDRLIVYGPLSQLKSKLVES